MPAIKEYKCERCGYILKRAKPIRIIVQEYDLGNYKQYSQVEKHDFCLKCYKIIAKKYQKKGKK